MSVGTFAQIRIDHGGQDDGRKLCRASRVAVELCEACFLLQQWDDVLARIDALVVQYAKRMQEFGEFCAAGRAYRELENLHARVTHTAPRDWRTR